MKTINVIWVNVDDTPGITSIGYLPKVKKLIGYNGFIIHQQVSLVRGKNEKELEEQYHRLRIERKADESSLTQRLRGSIQPYWSTDRPWYIVTLNDDGSFGLSLRQQDYADLIVTSDQIVPF